MQRETKAYTPSERACPWCVWSTQMQDACTRGRTWAGERETKREQTFGWVARTRRTLTDRRGQGLGSHLLVVVKRRRNNQFCLVETATA